MEFKKSLGFPFHGGQGGRQVRILKRAVYLFCLSLFVSISSCKQNEVDGIEIGSTLYENQSYEQNKKLASLITKALNKNATALGELTEFWCGGGAGCYDLGYVFTQITYEIGEEDLIKMSEALNKAQKASLEGFLDVGLEYGNYNTDKKTVTEFPKLVRFLNK